MKTWLTRKIHISWHVTAVSLGVITGVALALVVPSALFAGWEWLTVALLLFVVVVTRKSRWALILALYGGVICGLWVGSLKQLELAQYEPYYGQTVTLQGKISDDTVYGPDGDQRLRLDQIAINSRALDGEIWVSTNTEVELKRGDIITLRGMLDEGFGNLWGSMFSAQLVDAERPYPGDVARRVRDNFAAGVRESVPEPQASLGVSYLVGQRKALPPELSDEFRMLGLVHLVVASGFHLTIALRFIRRWFLRVSKFAVAAATSGVIFSFLLITGFSTSMTRAALVCGIGLAAWYYGRNVHPLVLLLVAAAITLLIDPNFLWGDIGWYLSFAAFGGVLLLAPLIHKFFWGDKEPGFMRYIFVATTSAQITTFPIIALSFSQYSPLALLSNLLIQPLVPFAMGLTFIAGIAGVVAPAAATIIGWPVYIILTYMTSVTSWLSSNPLAYSEVEFDPVILASFYAVLLFAMIVLRRRTGHSFRRDNLID